MKREIIVDTDDNFESCDNCIHSDDTENICKMRGCIHAITENDIKECYQTKESRKPPKGFPKGMTNGEFTREILKAFLRKES